MMKTALIATAVIFGAAAPTPHITAQLANGETPQIEATAQQVMIPLPGAESVIAQFSHLELSHDTGGFNLAITDHAAMFVDLEFPGEFHIRIGL